MTDTTYNGYANYETWNVSLWLQNDEGAYKAAKGYPCYDHFIPFLEIYFDSQCTPDGVRWMDPTINTDELDEMLSEL